MVVSAVLGYLLGLPEGAFSWSSLVALVLGGTLLTAASNALNQVIEVQQDSLMSRTSDRPLVKGTLSSAEAVIAAFLAGTIGILLLWLNFGPLTGILGFLSLFMYVALYTPMKKHSAWAVFVGAFPGAFPPMLGYVAATGHFGLGPGLLFAMQFIWQFPHFWAIAWVLNDDYKKAGYHLLPSKEGRDRSTAFLILLYSFLVIPVGMLPWVFGLTGWISMVIAILTGALMLIPAFRLYFSQDMTELAFTPLELIDRSNRTRKMLTWFIIFASVMFFAGLTSAFLVSMSGGYWVHIDMPRAFYYSTAAILASSIFAQLALASAQKNKRSMIGPLLSVTLLLGILFAFLQFRGWSEMVARGQYVSGRLVDLKGTYGEDYVISRGGQFLIQEEGQFYLPEDTRRMQPLNADIDEYKNTASSYIYALTGAHFFHLIFGLLSLVITVIMAFLGRYDQEKHAGLWSGVIYWHFLGGLWVYLLLFLTFVH